LPRVTLTAAPSPGDDTKYVVDLDWSAFDPDGSIVRFEYALDPPANGDTAWTATRAHGVTLTVSATRPPDPLARPGTTIVSRAPHTFALVAIDDKGGRSPVIARSFTARTVAPETYITTPVPTHVASAITLPQVELRWRGVDPDQPQGHAPVMFKYRFVSLSTVSPSTRGIVAPDVLQEYFGRDFANGYADWDSVPPDSAWYIATNLTPGPEYLFAVVARDEAGAYEPRFSLDSNVLQFHPTLDRTGPRLEIWNDFFHYTQNAGGVSLVPARIVTLEVPENLAMTFHWTATPVSGAALSGYRWAVDLPEGDITNETPRLDDSDTRHWSTWSLTEVEGRVGPFRGSPDSTVTHYLYVEVRDQVGFVTLATVRLPVVAGRFDRDLLLVDDLFGASDTRNMPYPVEAEQDSFLCAVGGFPDRLKGGTSTPGSFAGFAFDTLDTYFSSPRGKLPLSTLSRYKVVAVQLDNQSASPGSVARPMSTLLSINRPGELNTLAAYSRLGGKLFFFGEGPIQAVAYGFFNMPLSPPPLAPFGSSASAPRSYVLRPGCFLWDFMHLRSEVVTAGTQQIQFTLPDQLRGAIPYLPRFRGEASETDRSHDPRIGPTAERNVGRWDDLPLLSLTTYRGASPDPAQRSINQTWYVSKPMDVVEDGESALDTLYLVQARDYSGDGHGGRSDGKPNGLFYHGKDNPELVWLGFPLTYFEPDASRALVRAVLRNLGLTPVRPS
jgi:hypothetical protein